MRYQYGGLIRVTAPGGRTLNAQMGEQTGDGDVIIHIQSHGIETPAGVLRDEGWRIPEIMTSTVPSYAHEAKHIVASLFKNVINN